MISVEKWLIDFGNLLIMTKRFKTKLEGLRQAVKVWRCKSCGTEHHARKPLVCSKCKTNDFFYFASVFEARRYAQLSLLQRVGHIKDLRVQVKYPIKVNGVNICNYVADFVYYGVNGDLIIEDTKGDENAITETFKLKRKLIGALYGYKIMIVTRI